jgi:hypothetical protein
MSLAPEAAHAALVVRLLLEDAPPRAALAALDWSTLLRVAERSSTLVRVVDRLAALGQQPPVFVAAAVERERQRVREALDLVTRIEDVCAGSGIEALFPKVAQHYPDLGDDLDLLVVSRSRRVDSFLLQGLQARRKPGDLGSRIARSTTYLVEGCRTPLDIQHGRLGVAGEEGAFPALVWRERRRVRVGELDAFTASPEHLVVLHGVQRVYGRLGIDLGDVVAATTLVRRPGLDWTAILDTAAHLGVLPGLGAFLEYVEQIHGHLFGRPLLPAGPRSRLRLRRRGSITFRDGVYRHPMLRVNAALYARRLAAALVTRRWGTALRVCLVPIIGLARALRYVRRASRSTSATSLPAPREGGGGAIASSALPDGGGL